MIQSHAVLRFKALWIFLNRTAIPLKLRYSRIFLYFYTLISKKWRSSMHSPSDSLICLTLFHLCYVIREFLLTEKRSKVFLWDRFQDESGTCESCLPLAAIAFLLLVTLHQPEVSFVNFLRKDSDSFLRVQEFKNTIIMETFLKTLSLVKFPHLIWRLQCVVQTIQLCWI